MVITINESPADISLEHEQSLKEVIDGLDRWLKKEGFFMSGVMVNGKAVSLEDPGLTDLAVAEIQTLDIFAHELKELVLENVGTVYQYLYLLQSNITEGNTENISELLGELPFILTSIDKVLGSGDTSFSDRLKAMVDEAGFSNGVVKGEKQNLIAYLSTLILFLENLIREKTDPESEFFKTVRALHASIPGLREVTVLLQTGKDREAMETIITFSEISAKLTRLFPLVENSGAISTGSVKINGVSFGEFYSELNDFLHQLLEAFENEDSVLIGDLLEYEIAPRLESLVSAIGSFRTEKENSSS